MRKLLFLFLFLTVALVGSAQINQKPFVIPELQEWYGGEGSFKLNKKMILTVADNQELINNCHTFADEYEALTGSKIKIKPGKQSGNIHVALANIGMGEEGYRITITPSNVSIEADTPLGALWATKTLLQMSEQSTDGTLPVGVINDYPKFEQRGFMLDCGRKFFPLSYLEECIKIMSYYKMNAFQVHLNDNAFVQYFDNDWDKTYSAFRLESDTYPGLAAKDGHYTKKEFIELQKLADKYGVVVIPEIDAPAHSLAFTQYKPEIGSVEYGMDHLDLFKDETYQFMDALWHEYLSGDEPVFRGKMVHIGTDEYSNKKKEVVEKFRHYTNHYINLVESYGKQACLWGALTHAKGDTPVKSDNVIMSAWYNGYADPVEMVKQGYKLISIPDGLLYIVPAAGYYYDYLNIEKLYNTWTPPHVGKSVFKEDDPNILGGMFAVWNDHAGNGISVKDVHHRVFPAMQTLAVKMWRGAETALPWEDFNTQRAFISEAPGVNANGKYGHTPQMIYEVKRLRKGNRHDFEEVGYPYTVKFDVAPQSEEKGTELMRSSSAIFYLSDPQEGKVGFSRDGYLMRFNYELPKEGNVSLKIKGDNTYTELYANGKLVDRLDIQELTFNEKDKMKYVQTLVFPLREVGDFNSKVTNLQVFNY